MNRVIRKEHLQDLELMADLAHLGQLREGRALLRMLNSDLEFEKNELIDNPQDGGEDITKSMKYRAGFAAALKYVATLPEVAGKVLAGQRRPESHER